MSFDFCVCVIYEFLQENDQKMLFTWHVSANKHDGPVINRFCMSCVHIIKLGCTYDLDMSKILDVS
jgi:hypothetical protein